MMHYPHCLNTVNNMTKRLREAELDGLKLLLDLDFFYRTAAAERVNRGSGRLAWHSAVSAVRVTLSFLNLAPCQIQAGSGRLFQSSSEPKCGFPSRIRRKTASFVRPRAPPCRLPFLRYSRNSASESKLRRTLCMWLV